jgi:hypothetical protein
MDRQFIKYLLRYSKALDTQRFEIDLAIEHTLSEIIPASSLHYMHDERGNADSDE